MQNTTTRTCRRCKVERPLDDFYIAAERRQATRRGRTTICERPCRHCQRQKMAELREPRQAISDAAKLASGCMDCGLRPEILQVLEFDHRENEEKLFDISDRMTSGTIESLRAEIAKCDVVCANCHRIRTITRKQFGAEFGSQRVMKNQILKDNAAGLGHLWDPMHVDVTSHSAAHRNQLALF